jgi:hypothetical protein
MSSTDKKRISYMARIIVRLPWLWVAIAVLGTVFFGWHLKHIKYEFSLEALFVADSPLRQKLDDFVELFGPDDNVLVIAHGADDILSPAGYRRIEKITAAIEALPYFENTISLTSAQTIRGTAGGFEVSPLINITDPATADWQTIRTELLADPLVAGALLGKDAKATALSMEIKPEFNNNDGRAQIIGEVEAIIEPFKTDGEFHLSGIPQLRNAFVSYLRKDQAIFTPLCILMVSLMTLWLFRTAKAIAFAQIIIITTLVWTLGTMAIGGGTINIITVVLPSLILTLGTAYVTHFLSRYIEQTSKGVAQPQAILDTTKHMMLPIFLTSFTTGIGFASLMFMKIDLVRQMGLYAGIGLMFAFWMTLTLLPAICLKTKPFTRAHHLFSKTDRIGRYLQWNDRFVKKYPWPVIAFSLALLAISIFFITKVRVDSSLMQESNPNSPEYIAHTFMVENLSGIVSLEILLTADSVDAFKEPANLRALDKIQKFMRAQPGVDWTISFADFLKKMNRAMHENAPAKYTIPDTRQAVAQYLLLYEGEELDKIINSRFDKTRIALRLQDLGSKKIVQLEKDLIDYAATVLPPGIQMEMTGSSIMVGKLMDRLIIDMMRSLFFAAAIITLLMAILFKSARLGLLAMLPNFVPILMTMGLLGMLGITLRTSIVVVFPISLGIAVDDTIHFINRCRDEYKISGDYDDALQKTFLGSGRPIIFTSILLFLGFIVLAQSSFIPTQNFGMLSAATMVSALLGDLFLLPALLWVFKPKLN